MCNRELEILNFNSYIVAAYNHYYGNPTTKPANQ